MAHVDELKNEIFGAAPARPAAAPIPVPPPAPPSEFSVKHIAMGAGALALAYFGYKKFIKKGKK